MINCSQFSFVGVIAGPRNQRNNKLNFLNLWSGKIIFPLISALGKAQRLQIHGGKSNVPCCTKSTVRNIFNLDLFWFNLVQLLRASNKILDRFTGSQFRLTLFFTKEGFQATDLISWCRAKQYHSAPWEIIFVTISTAGLSPLLNQTAPTSCQKRQCQA
jgi:hypothetical protein